MADLGLELIRAEVEAMSDRELLLEIIKGQRVQNGTLARHDDDLYGNLARGIRGAKPLAEAHEVALDRQKAGTKALLGLVGVVGLANIITVMTIWRS